MSFKSIWGFDPKEAFNAQSAFLERIGDRQCEYSLAEQQSAQIPPDVRSQNCRVAPNVPWVR